MVDVRTGTQVYLVDRWFTVVGVLHPVPLAPELDSTALIGWPAAERYLDFDGHATTVYTRSDEPSIDAVRSVLGATANPEHPDEVRVSRPSEALEAQRASDRSSTGLLLGVVAVALLVGGVGLANTMVISVLERRTEIGLRRSLGATAGQIRTQFLAESLLLSLLGGAGGRGAGSYGHHRVRGIPELAGGGATLGDRGRCRCHRAGRDGRRALPGRASQPHVTHGGARPPLTGRRRRCARRDRPARGRGHAVGVRFPHLHRHLHSTTTAPPRGGAVVIERCSEGRFPMRK